MATENNLQDKHIEPKLLIPDYQGKHFTEYIPSNYSYLNNRIRDYYAAYRSKFGLQLYYWQVRFMFTPKERKVYDLNFMLHVEKDHNGKPDMLIERLHYYFAKRKYQAELNFIKSMEMLDWQMEHSKDIELQKHPYVKAYKKHWVENFRESPDWKTLYHGVNILELGPVLDKLKIKTSNRRNHLLRQEKSKSTSKGSSSSGSNSISSSSGNGSSSNITASKSKLKNGSKSK